MPKPPNPNGTPKNLKPFKKGNRGRPKGIVGKRIKAISEITMKALHGGLLPLELFLKFMRLEPISYIDAKGNPAVYQPSIDDMKWGAEAAAPFIHAKLANVQHSGNVVHRHEDFLDEIVQEANPPLLEAPKETAH